MVPIYASSTYVQESQESIKVTNIQELRDPTRTYL